MSKIKKILPIVLGIGLLNGCFGLTIAAKPPKATKVEQNSKENKKVNYAYGFQFDYCFKNAGMEKNYGKQENPAKFKGDFSKLKVLNKSDVNNALALFIMVREALLSESKNNNILKHFFEHLDGNLVNLVTFNFIMYKRIHTSGTSASPGILSKKEVNELKRILTKEKLREVKITAEKLEEAKKIIISNLKEAFKTFTDMGILKNGVTLNYKDRVKEVENAKLEDVKKAAKDFEDCKLRIKKVPDLKKPFGLFF